MRGGRAAEGTRQPGHGPAPAEAPRRPAPLSEDDLLGVPVPGGEP
jgi:hypothetical protein